MKELKKKFSRRVLFFVILGLIFMVLLGLLYNRTYETTKDSYLNAEMDAFESKIFTTLQLYENFSGYVFDNDINNEPVLSLMEQALDGDEQIEAEARANLYDLLSDTYELLGSYHFRQLHFHTPEGDSFLRFHIPERFGDNLMDIRDTIRIVNTEERFIFGFEEGRIFNGYRFVYPLHADDIHLGSVEVSISMASLVAMMADLYPEKVLSFLIQEDVVDNTVFENEQDNYISAEFFPGYYLDREITDHQFRNICDETYKINCSLITKTVDNHEAQIEAGESFNALLNQNGYDFLMSFLSVRNISDEHVAYLIGVHEVDHGEVFGTYHLYSDLILLGLFFTFYFSSLFVYERKQNQLDKTANTDQLTGLFNRHKMMALLRYHSLLNQKTGANFMIILMDVDDFKKVNDVYGHNTGDQVLVETAEILREITNKQGEVSRWGGEEFMILMPGCSKEEGTHLAERVRERIEDTAFTDGIRLTASLGVSSFEDLDKQSIDSLVHDADQKMYQSKEAGKNRVSV